MAEAQPGHREHGGERKMRRESLLHLRQETMELLRKEGVPLFAIRRDWKANPSRWIARQIQIAYRVLDHRTEDAIPPLHGGGAVAAAKLRIDPLLDLHGTKLKHVDSTEVLEDVVLQG